MYFIILSNRYLKKFHYKIQYLYHTTRKYNKILLEDKTISNVLSLSLLNFRITEVK